MTHLAWHIIVTIQLPVIVAESGGALKGLMGSAAPGQPVSTLLARASEQRAEPVRAAQLSAAQQHWGRNVGVCSEHYWNVTLHLYILLRIAAQP